MNQIKNDYRQNHGESGVVYILENPGLKAGVIKIGASRHSGHARANQLNESAGTGTPGLFTCVFECRTSDCGRAEERVHEIFHERRLGKHGIKKDGTHWGQEFFEVDLAEAKKTITKICKSIDDAIVKPEAKHRNFSQPHHFQNQTSARAERAFVIDPTDGPLYLQSNASDTKVISKKVVALIVFVTIMVVVFSGESDMQRNSARHEEPATQQDVLSAQQVATFEAIDNETALIPQQDVLDTQQVAIFEAIDNETAPATQRDILSTQHAKAMSVNVRASLQGALADTAVTHTAFRHVDVEKAWLSDMSRRLSKHMPDETERLEFLRTLHWEASLAGIDPQLMLGLIEIESGFRKYEVSPKGARGYTQVMPYWVERIGTPDHNLFHMRTNLRYGALILRHYIDLERGDLFLALGHYDNRGRPGYPNRVIDAWKRNWDFELVSRNVDAGRNDGEVDNSVNKERREEITREQAERDRLKKAEGDECQISAECAGILVCAKVTPSAMQCMSSDAALKQYSKFP